MQPCLCPTCPAGPVSAPKLVYICSREQIWILSGPSGGRPWPAWLFSSILGGPKCGLFHCFLWETNWSILLVSCVFAPISFLVFAVFPCHAKGRFSYSKSPCGSGWDSESISKATSSMTFDGGVYATHILIRSYVSVCTADCRPC